MWVILMQKGFFMSQFIIIIIFLNGLFVTHLE